jgi:uncharacterized protein YbjQ (UPF0145 family)
VAGTSVFHASGAGRGWQLTTRECTEVGHLTKGLYGARDLAVRRLRAAAAKLGAAGLVGVELTRESREIGHSAIFVVQVLGTAIAQDRTGPHESRALPVLDLGGRGAGAGHCGRDPADR